MKIIATFLVLDDSVVGFKKIKKIVKRKGSEEKRALEIGLIKEEIWTKFRTWTTQYGLHYFFFKFT